MRWADRYIGLPFGGGSGAVTCWSLVRRVYAEVARIDLPAFAEIDPRDLVRIAVEMEGARDLDPWVPVESPRALDVALMHVRGRRVAHVGVMLDAETVLHVERSTAAVAVPIRHPSVSWRLAGFRRHREVMA